MRNIEISYILNKTNTAISLFRILLCQGRLAAVNIILFYENMHSEISS